MTAVSWGYGTVKSFWISPKRSKKRTYMEFFKARYYDTIVCCFRSPVLVIYAMVQKQSGHTVLNKMFNHLSRNRSTCNKWSSIANCFGPCSDDVAAVLGCTTYVVQIAHFQVSPGRHFGFSRKEGPELHTVSQFFR